MGADTHGGGSGNYIPWLPDPDMGRWQSALGVSFAPQGFRLRVFDPDGNLIPTMDELEIRMEAQEIRMEAQLEAQAREIAALRAALRQRDGN